MTTGTPFQKSGLTFNCDLLLRGFEILLTTFKLIKFVDEVFIGTVTIYRISLALAKDQTCAVS